MIFSPGVASLPEESSSHFVHFFYHSFGQKIDGHVINWGTIQTGGY